MVRLKKSKERGSKRFDNIKRKKQFTINYREKMFMVANSFENPPKMNAIDCQA